MNHTATQLALRAHLRTLSVATTGSTTMAATTTGYTRTTGSFITDGFAAGMEVVPTGFASNPRDVITRVEALTLTVQTARTAQAAAAGRTLAVGLPGIVGYDNIAITPIAGRPYAEEDYVPGPATVKTLRVGAGTQEDTGLYVVRWFGPSDTGISGITRCADAVLTHFAPGTTLTTSEGDTVRIRADVAPYRGALTQIEGGWAACAVTIPWRVYSLTPA